jgi:hypothetical protein
MMARRPSKMKTKANCDDASVGLEPCPYLDALIALLRDRNVGEDVVARVRRIVVDDNYSDALAPVREALGRWLWPKERAAIIAFTSRQQVRSRRRWTLEDGETFVPASVRWPTVRDEWIDRSLRRRAAWATEQLCRADDAV